MARSAGASACGRHTPDVLPVTAADGKHPASFGILMCAVAKSTLHQFCGRRHPKDMFSPAVRGKYH